MTTRRPPEIRCDVPGSYPYGVLTRRHPTIVEQVRAAHPYGPRQLRALDELADEITGTVRPLPPGAPSAERLAPWAEKYVGRPWLETPFLFAEGYFYAKLLAAVDWPGPAPWTGVDPFAGMKAAELADDGYAADVAALDSPSAGLEDMLLGALWGNRADLGFLIEAPDGAGGARHSHLVADDSAELLALLGSGTVRRLCVLADNTGRELLADLVLLDRLLTTGLVEHIEVQLKPHPYFISDATMPDLLNVLHTLPGPLGARLDTAFRAGRLDPVAHWFSGTPYEYARMPEDLATHLGTFDLVLAKGDLNYRRLVGDRYWPATTPFATALGDFPTRLATLRTVKSDVVVGLADTGLDERSPGWRTTGRYALIQMT